MPISQSFPRGAEFLTTVITVEDACLQQSMREIPALGLSFPACIECLGNVLSSLYAEAACLHGCSEGDHFFQRISAKAVTNSLSSIRLAMMGYYDESLALTRSVGEIANLLFLFAAKPNALKDWRESDDRARKQRYSAVKVRIAIQEINLRPPVDHETYSLLCEVGVHLVPAMAPQAFNPHKRPSLGASFQYEGLMVAINELAVAVAETAACLSVFPEVGLRRLDLQTESAVLLNVVGRLSLSKSVNQRVV